jgi:hypothetical protein
VRFKNEDVITDAAAAALRFLGSGKAGGGARLRAGHGLGDLDYNQVTNSTIAQDFYNLLPDSCSA